MTRVRAVLLLAAFLGGCNEPVAKEPINTRPAGEIGRWIIVPASTGTPIFRGGTANYVAWKLDTITGGPVDKPQLEQLTCIAERK